MLADVHQHLWTEDLLEALAARSEAPRVRRAEGAWVLDLASEPSSPLPPDDVHERAAEARAAGLGLVCVSLSAVLGIEGLPRDQAEHLIDAHERGVRGAGEPFRHWAAIPLADGGDPGDVDAALDRGAIGLCLPAGALADSASVERCGPLLERLERRATPLFVHPGPSPWEPAAAPESGPSWWPALAGYVPAMHRAWHAWIAAGRREHPRLQVVFALLAGLAPLHAPRLAARGGPADAVRDPRLFYDTSSYGAGTPLAAMRAQVGAAQLVYGSDRPVAPRADDRLAAHDAIAARNAAELVAPLPAVPA
jgi:6-methylsalicylate decarboxylase